jgi:hypothetical protein
MFQANKISKAHKAAAKNTVRPKAYFESAHHPVASTPGTHAPASLDKPARKLRSISDHLFVLRSFDCIAVNIPSTSVAARKPQSLGGQKGSNAKYKDFE